MFGQSSVGGQLAGGSGPPDSYSADRLKTDGSRKSPIASLLTETQPQDRYTGSAQLYRPQSSESSFGMLPSGSVLTRTGSQDGRYAQLERQSSGGGSISRPSIDSCSSRPSGTSSRQLSLSLSSRLSSTVGDILNPTEPQDSDRQRQYHQPAGGSSRLPPMDDLISEQETRDEYAARLLRHLSEDNSRRSPLGDQRLTGRGPLGATGTGPLGAAGTASALTADQQTTATIRHRDVPSGFFGSVSTTTTKAELYVPFPSQGTGFSREVRAPTSAASDARGRPLTRPTRPFTLDSLPTSPFGGFRTSSGSRYGDGDSRRGDSSRGGLLGDFGNGGTGSLRSDNDILFGDRGGYGSILGDYGDFRGNDSCILGGVRCGLRRDRVDFPGGSGGHRGVGGPRGDSSLLPGDCLLGNASGRPNVLGDHCDLVYEATEQGGQFKWLKLPGSAARADPTQLPGSAARLAPSQPPDIVAPPEPIQLSAELRRIFNMKAKDDRQLFKFLFI